MKKLSILMSMMLLVATYSYAQVAINKDGSAPDAASILHVKGDNAGTSVEALYVKSVNGYVGIGTTTPGALLDVAGHIWETNTGASVFLGENAGTNDDLSNNENTFVGFGAGNANTSGYFNVACGKQALASNTTGRQNIAIGHEALVNNTTGVVNIAIGEHALYSNTTKSVNIAIGDSALFSNTGGSNNIAIGAHSLLSDETASANVAIGREAMKYTKAGSNVAVGHQAMISNIWGTWNVAIGREALSSNQYGKRSVAVGYQSQKNTTATQDAYNTSVGTQTLFTNTSGKNNTAVGGGALYTSNGSGNVAIGFDALHDYTGDNNTVVGTHADLAGNYSNCTAIGYNAQPSGSNRVHIGNSSVSWIGGQVGWSTYSDKRIKQEIEENVKGLDFILRLRPVTYHLDIDREQQLLYGKVDKNNWKGKYDIEKIRFSGFIAQEVEEAAKASNYDFSGVIPPEKGTDHGLYTMRYSDLVVPLVKAVQEQQEIIKQMKKELDDLREWKASMEQTTGKK